MPLETFEALEARLRDDLTRALRRESAWGDLYGEIFGIIRDNGLNCFLFGGTVRDVLINGVAHRPRDLDIVFDESSFDQFSHLFAQSILKRNRFGGLKCVYKGVTIDAWPLQKTWAITKGFASGTDFDVLPKTAFFNLDAIVAEIAPAQWSQRRIFDRGFFEGVKRREIECNLEKTDFPELNIVRGFALAQATGFSFSNSFCHFVVKHLSRIGADEIEALQFDHYKRVRLSGEFIAQTVRSVRDMLAHDSQATFEPKFPNAPRLAQLQLEMDPDPSWLDSSPSEETSKTAVSEDHLFISYATQDERLASWLARKLAARGHPVWFDRLKMLGGESWPQTIDDAIKNRTFRMLALLSKHSIQKSKPTGERTLAQRLGEQRGIPDFLIPLKVDNCELDWLTTCSSYISFSRGWADGWNALIKKLDSIGAKRSLINASPLAASSFPRGDDLLSQHGETLFTNVIPIKSFPKVFMVYRIMETLSADEWQKLHEVWSFYKLADDALVAIEQPPASFSNRIRLTPERCLWTECELFRRIPSRHIASRLILATLERKLRAAGCHDHPNVRLRGTFYLPSSFSADGKLTFIGFTGRKTWLLIKGRVTFRRGATARETNFHHFAFRIRLARGLGPSFYIQITPTLVFFDETGRPILDTSVGSRRRRVTKMWWNDKWLNRLLAAKHLLTSLPAKGEEDVLLEPNLLTVSAKTGIREEAFGLTDQGFLSEEDLDNSELILDELDGEEVHELR